MANEQLKTLEDKLSYAYDTKVAIHDAIIAKGVEVPEGTVFRDYAGKIAAIQTGSSLETATLTYNVKKSNKLFFTNPEFELVEVTNGASGSSEVPVGSIITVSIWSLGHNPTVSGSLQEIVSHVAMGGACSYVITGNASITVNSD